MRINILTNVWPTRKTRNYIFANVFANALAVWQVAYFERSFTQDFFFVFCFCFLNFFFYYAIASFFYAPISLPSSSYSSLPPTRRCGASLEMSKKLLAL